MSAKVAEHLARAVRHRLGAAGFIDWLDFARARSAPNLIVRIRLMQANTVRTAQVDPGRSDQ
jgi:hypothetical protein